MRTAERRRIAVESIVLVLVRIVIIVTVLVVILIVMCHLMGPCRAPPQRRPTRKRRIARVRKANPRSVGFAISKAQAEVGWLLPSGAKRARCVE